MSRTLIHKVLMALTGLFLVLFLVGHLSGNLQLLLPMSPSAVQLQFNAYAHFMTTNPFVKGLSYGTYAAFLLHIFYALWLTLANRRARGGRGYASGPQKAGASWASRNMGLLGALILIFLLIHLRSFWYVMHWGPIQYDQNQHKDLYTVVVRSFQVPLYVAFYVGSMGVLAYHLWHGFQSAFRSLGLYQMPYSPLIALLGRIFAIVVPALFALIPIWIYLANR